MFFRTIKEDSIYQKRVLFLYFDANEKLFNRQNVLFYTFRMLTFYTKVIQILFEKSTLHNRCNIYLRVYKAAYNERLRIIFYGEKEFETTGGMTFSKSENPKCCKKNCNIMPFREHVRFRKLRFFMKFTFRCMSD